MVLSSARMPDPRLPIAIKKLPGGYRLQFNDGKSSMMVYGTGADTARATGSLTTEEARELAEEVVRILTEAWGSTPA
jgi:hypothetical protein